jgi:signal transduction histidine kinase
MRLDVSKKIAYSELVIIAVIYGTLIPYILICMDFRPIQLFHYIVVTMMILTPLGIASSYYFIDRWEGRPIEMLTFYLERRLEPPDDVMAAALVRTLNLPLLHAITVLIRYEFFTLLGCLYMGIFGGLLLKDNIRLALTAGIGLSFFPIFSFFLTERLLYPFRQILSEKTKTIQYDGSRVMQINTRTRLLFILLAAVLAPLLALGSLVYRHVGMELTARFSDLSQVQPVMSQLFNVIISVTRVALLLAAGIGILLATSISNPLGHLVKIIRELEKGNLKARTHLISNDEIGVLSGSFDKMAQQLEKNRSELEDLNRTLEFRVAKKTENLTKAYERIRISNRDLSVANRDLEDANKKLREIDRLKSDFISIVSHELRTPLTSIKAFTELILMKPRMTAERKTKMLHTINTESDRLSRLISNILDLTKIESGNVSWNITPVILADIIRTSVSSLQSLADNKLLTITTQIQDPLPTMYGDRDRLIQVVANILSNAIKYTPKGGSIGIAAHLEETPKPRIVVRVTDTGVGIRDSDLKLIFEKFRRSGDVLTNNTEGTGLGLAITRQIVEGHGGTIWAQSKVGEGSMFIFTLPLDKHLHREGLHRSIART